MPCGSGHPSPEEPVVTLPPPPVSPPARRVHQPSWLDLRLVAGVLLVLASVVLGADAVARADRTVEVWALARNLDSGTTVQPADVRAARVRLVDTAPAYLLVSQSPVGRTVSRTLRAGELLPRSALVALDPGLVLSIPVDAENAPGIARGQSVDVWASARGCLAARVLVGVPVQDVRQPGGGGLSARAGRLQVIVRVGAEEAGRMVRALGAEATIRLVVREGSAAPHPSTAPSTPDPAAGCPPTGTPTSLPSGTAPGR